MLTETMKMRLASGEEIPLATCHCETCDNNFFVAVIHENEPKYCPYCGIKFLAVTPNDGPRREILGE